MTSNAVQLSALDAQALERAIHALEFAVRDVQALTQADNPLLAELARQMLAPVVAASQQAQVLSALVERPACG